MKYTRIFAHGQEWFLSPKIIAYEKKETRILISYAPLFRTMKEKKITSYKLEKLGFSRATYYSIQKGNSVSTNTINQLCKLLQCNVSEVIEFIDDTDMNT